MWHIFNDSSMKGWCKSLCFCILWAVKRNRGKCINGARSDFLVSIKVFSTSKDHFNDESEILSAVFKLSLLVRPPQRRRKERCWKCSVLVSPPPICFQWENWSIKDLAQHLLGYSRKNKDFARCLRRNIWQAGREKLCQFVCLINQTWNNQCYCPYP